ncbi:MAG: hypothetical protein IAE80_30285 [Anaerolinea sp.]|nr:hypothetical protein [Anaerolinea sp.]
MNDRWLDDDPLDEPGMPAYYFGYGVGEHEMPSLEAVKTWLDGDDRRFDTFTVAEYGSYDEAARDEDELNAVLETRGVEAAIQLAEGMAVAGGYLDRERTDGRVFFADDAPADPFTTLRQQTLEREVAETHLDYGFALLQPDPDTLELTAYKGWIGADGQAGVAELTLQTFELPPWAVEAEIERERAALALETLLRVNREDGLEAAMQRAEALAVANGALAADRDDPRLFAAGPPDPFQTRREWELTNEIASVSERVPLVDITGDETQELPIATPEPGSWDELIERERVRAAQPEPEREVSYWRLDTRPLESPEGEPQGYGLFITVFPELPADLDRYIEEHGIDDTITPTHARRLEIAHFETEWAAEKYAKEFRGYLIPGLLDGPELAEEAAKLEGMPGTWEAMDYRDIVEDMNRHRSVAREADERQVHQPNAEREAEIPSGISAPDLDF